MSLLSTGASRVIAVDRRLDQVFVTELKAAAIDALGYAEFRQFVGLDQHSGRQDTYQRIRPVLGLRCRRYWDARSRLVEEGILYAGRLERRLSGFCKALRSMQLFEWPDLVFKSGSVAEQRKVLHEHLRGVRAGSLYWGILCNPLGAWIAMQDPSFLRCTEGVLGTYLFGRFLKYAETRLVRESFFLHLIYYGRYNGDGPLPVYLGADQYEAVRKNVARLEIRNCRVEDVLSQVGRRGATKWSLSDISAWMTRSHFDAFLRGLAEQLQPGDRVCYRNFGVVYGLPLGLGGRVARLHALCEEVEALDTSAFFRIEIAEAQ